MFLRPKRPLLANKAFRRPPGAKATVLAKRLGALQEAEEARQVFLQCSGMHTKYVKWIIQQVCFRTWWVKMPFSCAEFVVPALSLGIPQHWENLVAAQAEMAVYASLFMTIYLGMFLGGFNPPNSTDKLDDTAYKNLRAVAYYGYYPGLALGLLNILCGVAYRLVGSYLPRDSDKLVMMWAFRWLPPLNAIIFIMGVFMGVIAGVSVGEYAMRRGDFCMDGSATFTQWYGEWVRESYPTGKGVIHHLGVPIINPWAVAADAANISRPDASYYPRHDVELQHELHPSFLAYEEFMVHQLGLQGGGCFGGQPDAGFWYLQGLVALVFPFLFLRSPSLYWFRPWRAKKDPYDLSAVYQEFRVRAKIGQEMADKDKNGDGFVKPEGVYTLESAKGLLGEADAPSVIALDEPVEAALQLAGIPTEDLRPYAEDTPLRDHRYLDKMLQDAGVADVGARFKAIKILSGAEAAPGDISAAEATNGQPGRAKPNQVAPVSA